MVDDIRAVLSPLLLISYVFGTRIIEFPISKPRPWCSFLYMMLLWSVYHFLLQCTALYFIINTSFVPKFCICLTFSITLLSVILGIYHDKKYRTCLTKLAIVDITLEKIGTMTDYQKMYTRILLIVFGWFAGIICLTYANSFWYREYYSAIYSLFISFMIQYCTYVNLVDDLIIISTLGYIELKFKQINNQLRKLEGNNEQGIEQACGHSTLLPIQSGYPKSMSREYATWVAIHLHLELCKISRQLNSIFGLQMTVKMAIYFALVAMNFREIFNIMLIANYNSRKTLFTFSMICFLVLNISRLFIINYMCEKVSVKAKTTGDVISRISYSTYDVKIRENVSQFLLQMSLTPLKFYGLGLFQFGLKFFHGFSSSVTTVIVILIQSHQTQK